MNPEIIFAAANATALLSWIWLAIAPRWIWTRRIVQTAIPLLLSAAYLALIVAFFGQADGGFGSLAEVMKLFANPNAALAGWIHYLSFDLFVGAWETRDAQKRGVSHLLVLPCLALTFLFGPVGFLLYFIVRTLAAKKEAQ